MLTALLFRRINVTGSRLSMADLRGTLADAGYPDGRTILASGNAVVSSDEPVDVGRLEKLIADRHGFTTEVFVRSETEMEALPQVNPFDGAEGKVELVFLGADPTDEVVSGIGAIATGPDTLRVIGREIWWLRPVPIDQSIPKETDLRRVLGADSTRRTFGTVEKIIAVMEAMRRA